MSTTLHVNGAKPLDAMVAKSADAMLKMALKPLAVAPEAEVEKMFKKMDVDGSAGVDIAEFGNFFKALGCDSLSNELLSYLLQKVDTDGNGTIEYTEFLKVVKGYAS